MKGLYAGLERQRDLGGTYRQRYGDLQVIVATTTDTSMAVSWPVQQVVK